MIKIKITFMRLKLVLILIFFCYFDVSWAVPISITSISDLDFGIAFLSDPSKTVLPGVLENAENASFLITGDPNRAFTISLPNKINLTQVVGNQKIQVNNFTSFPSGSSTLDSLGKKLIFVGATRTSIKPNQNTGLYVGTFTVTVVY